MRQQRTQDRRSRYSVAQVGEIGGAPTVWITDDNGWQSVTNDAERVCAGLHVRFPAHRIIYRDSSGVWDELVHSAGIFQGFKAAREHAPNNQKGTS